jgi:protein-tyrosine phosphatase
MIFDCNELLQDRLWVGSFVRPDDILQLKHMGITAIISMQSDRDLSDYNISENKLLQACEAAEIELHRIPTHDFDQSALSANVVQAVLELENALTPRGAKAYVHCTAGVNRGPTVAAAYLIKTMGLSAQAACDYVTSRRRCSPYLGVLQQFETSLNNEQLD